MLRLTLRQLLIAQPGVGVKTAEAVMTTLTHIVGCGSAGQSQRTLTVQWLIDPRAHGRRVLALIDAMDDRAGLPPWPGFPLAPPK